MNTPVSNETIQIVTANAHEGRFVSSGGLAEFADVDVMMLQEVHPDRDDLEHHLQQETDLRLVIASDAMRLAVAIHKDRKILDTHKIPIQSAGFVVNGLRSTLSSDNRIVRRFRDRGLLGVSLDFDRSPVSAVTSHVNVAARPLKRAHHLEQTPAALDTIKGSLIFGGDMNHWPGPRGMDERMREHANLLRVPLADPTWVSHESNPQQRMLGAVLDRFDASLDAEMDAMFWRNDGSIALEDAAVVPIASDHRAIVATFSRTD